MDKQQILKTSDAALRERERERVNNTRQFLNFLIFKQTLFFSSVFFIV